MVFKSILLISMIDKLDFCANVNVLIIIYYKIIRREIFQAFIVLYEPGFSVLPIRKFISR